MQAKNTQNAQKSFENFIPVLFRNILNCPDEHLFKRNRPYRKLCNSSKMSGASLPCDFIIYVCVCAYSGMIRGYVTLAGMLAGTLADITLHLPTDQRPATSDQRMVTNDGE